MRRGEGSVLCGGWRRVVGKKGRINSKRVKIKRTYLDSSGDMLTNKRNEKR